MARTGRIEQQLAELQVAADGPVEDTAMAALRQGLGASSIVAAKAARIVGRRGIDELTPKLVAVFNRFMVRPVKTDKGCLAKTASAEALRQLESRDAAVFLRGIRHVQMEPAYGGTVDTAAELRGVCALGLAQTYHAETRIELTRLLVDPELTPRAAAVRALGSLGTEPDELLLRLKALTGDAEAEVLGECLSALLVANPTRSLEFAGSFLRNADMDVVQEAAVALGESGVSGAYDLLWEQWDQHIESSYREMLILPLALTRNEEAREVLLDVVRRGTPSASCKALSGLALFPRSEALCSLVEQAANARSESRVRAAYDNDFGSAWK